MTSYSDQCRIKQLTHELREKRRSESVCAEAIKGDVVIEYVWSNGKSDTIIMHSDEAEAQLIKMAPFAVYHALCDGEATLTIKVRKSRGEREPPYVESNSVRMASAFRRDERAR